MKLAGRIGRMGGLAVALGAGAWLCSLPLSAPASADSSGMGIATFGGLDPASLVGLTGSDPSGLNIDVSYNGMDLFHMGDATAHTGTGDFAIAYGDGASAEAGYGTTASGLSLVGQHDSAFADGAGSTAIAGGGDYDSATASNGATADSGFFVEPGVSGTGGSDDIASASGAGSMADAAGQMFNTATASGGGTADSGFIDHPGVGVSQGGTGDSAIASGAGSTAAAGFGNGDSASVSGTGDSAIAGFGNNDIAQVLGDHSGAFAGGIFGGPEGSNDFAASFGNLLQTLAVGSNNVVEIGTPFGSFDPIDVTAGATPPVDDLGLTDVLSGATSWVDGLLGL
jgi:hypothetical protein